MDNGTMLAQEFIKIIAQFKKFGFAKDQNMPLKNNEYMLLFTLSNCGKVEATGMKASEIIETLNITPGAVTHIINSLEKKGFIERVNDFTDRRIVLIKPNEKGNDVIKMMNSLFFEKLKKIIEFLGDEDAKELNRILSKTLKFVREGANASANAEAEAEAEVEDSSLTSTIIDGRERGGENASAD
jgi:DNA-binding MarR family transcriptional regulator